jgi:hypothetical protein
MTRERVVCLYLLVGSEYFLRLWSYFTGPDPTGGQVNYLSRAEAQKKGLAFVGCNNKAGLRVDSWTSLAHGAPRDSCVVSLKLAEVPTNLMPSSFPITAFVLFPGRHSTMVSLLPTLTVCHSVVLYGLLFGWWAPTGPIMERSTLSRVSITNRRLVIFFPFHRHFISGFRNQYTFHAGANKKCSIPNQAPIIDGGQAFTGTVMNTDCRSSASSNTGCAFLDTCTTSFGQGFANVGGGVFALLRNSDGFKIWHFERQSIPDDVYFGDPDPDSWPAPKAFLSADGCAVDSLFSPQSLILDITVCGGWASGDYPNSGCPGTCAQQVTTGSNYLSAYFMNFLSVMLYRYESRCRMAYQFHNCL